ncbi:sporulation protein [Actinophytocola sp.]|uniref:sporulation protein n=1 Tax=Actinophytocola sp. TaxID=1872138 RepID=UPI002ED286F1
MKIDDLLSRVTESAKARMVYGDPVEKDGVTVIPAAQIVGGGGGGDGTDRRGAHGSGGGLGLIARPVGAFVIKDGEVRWQPTFDVNRLIAVGGAVAIGGLLLAGRIIRSAATRKGAAAD